MTVYQSGTVPIGDQIQGTIPQISKGIVWSSIGESHTAAYVPVSQTVPVDHFQCSDTTVPYQYNQNMFGIDKVQKILEILDRLDVEKLIKVLDYITIEDGKIKVDLSLEIKKKELNV